MDKINNPKRSRGFRWPDEVKAAVVLAVDTGGLTREKAAEMYGIPLSTVKRWMLGKEGLKEMRANFSYLGAEDLANRMAGLRDKCLDRMDGLVNDRATTFRDLTIAAGVLSDKERLFRGESTNIQEIRSGEEYKSDIQRKLRSALAVSGEGEVVELSESG